MESVKCKFFSYLGFDSKPVSHREKIISTIGGFVGIFCVYFFTKTLVGEDAAFYIVPSMGATAVLVFAVPHSTLGQVWNVLGGHLLSATVGVLCALMIANQTLAAATSVGLAISVMYYARCIHPPGGATALAAVVGGESIQSLGFEYLITPVAVNVLIILLIAVGFNALFEWRRYPAYLVRNNDDDQPANNDYAPIDHADLVYALSQIDTFMDVTEKDLLRIYQLATGREVPMPLDPDSV